MINGLTFDEEQHIYRINGKRKTSVSDILKIYDSIHYGGISPKIMFEAAERGSRVHSFTEQYDLSKDFDVAEFREENQDIDGYILAYLRFCQEQGNAFYCVEEPFYSAEFDYCCTVDRIRPIFNKRLGVDREAVVDIKTTKTVLTFRNQLQLTLYGIAVYGLENYHKHDYYVLHLSAYGDYELIEVEPLSKDFICFFIELYRKIKKG